MEQRYKKRQLARIRKRQQRKKRRRVQSLALGVTLSVAVILTGLFLIGKLNENSSAASQKNVVSPAYVNKPASTAESVPEEDAKSVEITYMTEEEKGAFVESKHIDKRQVQAFTDDLDVFLVTKQDSVIYTRDNAKSLEVAVLPEGTYVASYGEEDGWTKVESKGQMGYMKSDDLDAVQDPDLFKVVNSTLIVNAKYGVAQSYQTIFQPAAESAMRVMLEGMERDGLRVEIGATYRSAEDEAREIVLSGNQGKHAPQPGHAEFQTGLAVEFYVAGTDPRMDNDFEKTEQAKWLQANAYKYGFILRYPEGSESITGYRADPTIYRYVGIDAAKEMHDRGLTMEEYYGV